MISFLICGAQKSGTSALHEYLFDHPQISLSKTKELHIFDNEQRDWSATGIKNIDNEVEIYYKDNGKDKIRGEATPSSMWWKPAMKRIWKYNRNMKFIAILRNPVYRAYSNWRMEVNKGREVSSLQLTMEAEEERCREALPNQHRIYSYLGRGLYTEQIRRIWQYFPRKNLLLIKQENLRKNPSDVLRTIYRHIGVKEEEFKGAKYVISWNSETNYDNTKPSEKEKQQIPITPSKAIKERLSDLYRTEILTLEDITGWDCSDWYE